MDQSDPMGYSIHPAELMQNLYSRENVGLLNNRRIWRGCSNNNTEGVNRWWTGAVCSEHLLSGLVEARLRKVGSKNVIENHFFTYHGHTLCEIWGGKVFQYANFIYA